MAKIKSTNNELKNTKKSLKKSKGESEVINQKGETILWPKEKKDKQ
jgi:hypothetical protein